MMGIDDTGAYTKNARFIRLLLEKRPAQTGRFSLRNNGFCFFLGQLC